MVVGATVQVVLRAVMVEAVVVVEAKLVIEMVLVVEMVLVMVVAVEEELVLVKKPSLEKPSFNIRPSTPLKNL